MALFQKKPQVTSTAPLYTVGANKTVLVVGLGNIGKQYDGTRHNVGFAAIDDFAKRNEFPAWVDKKDLHAQITIHQLGANRVILAKPTTLMNDSGQAVASLQNFYKATNPQTLVVYDELAIPFGSLRTRVGGTDAGHNGVKSLIVHVGADFNRLRIGVGSEVADKTDAADFVLAKFSKKEQGHIPAILRETGAIVTEFIFNGQLNLETRKLL